MSTQNPRGASVPTQAEFDALSGDVLALTTEVNANTNQLTKLGRFYLDLTITLGANWSGTMNVGGVNSTTFTQYPMLRIESSTIKKILVSTNRGGTEFSSGTMGS